MHPYEVLRRPILTEKTDTLGEIGNQFVFEVHPSANKRQVRDAVKLMFEVDVVDVRTMMMPGKSRRWGRHVTKSTPWKKAVVTVAAGQRIDFAE